MAQIFEIDNYREVIKKSLLVKKEKLGREYTFEKMAQACRIQRTYLSSVLSGNGHLNSDQVYMACQFLGFNEAEYNYTSLLNECERSVFPARHKFLQREITELRNRFLQTETHINSSVITSSDSMNEFYLDFNAQLIHMFLTIGRYKEDLKLLQQSLHLPSSVFQNSLKKLEAAGLISVRVNNIVVNNDNFHLSPNSSMYPTYRTQMRLRAMHQMQRLDQNDHYSFSVLLSSNETSKRRIQTDFLKFINRTQKESQLGEPEDVYQINFDLLKWSE